MSQPANIIENLVEDLTPVQPLPKPWLRALSWSVVSVALVFGLLYFWQPFRSSFLQDLASSPLYAAENLLGMALVFVFAFTGFVLAVPGASELRFMKAVSILLFVGWALVFSFNMFDPALAPSMNGKREMCWLEVIVYGFLVLVSLLFLLRKSCFLDRRLVGLFAGVGAGFIPFVGMQLGCMYIPDHVLKFHLLPMIFVVAVSVLIARRILPRV